MRYSYLFILLFIHGCHLNKITEVEEINGRKIYHSIGTSNEGRKKVFTKHGDVNAIFIPTKVIDTNNSLTPNASSITMYLSKYQERLRNKSVIVVIDWEGKIFKELKSERRTEAIKKFIRVRNIIRRNYPKIKIGIYGLPYRNYWKRDTNWSKQNLELEYLLKHFDFISPSIYDFYKNKQEDYNYVEANVKEALKLGENLSKPVLPIVWNRYHDSNKKHGLCLIPHNEFKLHIASALCADYKGNKIQGVIWWSAENYFNKVAKNRAGTLSNLNLLSTYYKVIVDLFTNDCQINETNL